MATPLGLGFGTTVAQLGADTLQDAMLGMDGIVAAYVYWRSYDKHGRAIDWTVASVKASAEAFADQVASATESLARITSDGGEFLAEFRSSPRPDESALGGRAQGEFIELR